MTLEEKNQKLENENAKLKNQLAEVYGDIQGIVAPIKSAFERLDIDPSIFEGNVDIMSLAGQVMPKFILVKDELKADFEPVLPVLMKYQHLITENE